MVNSISSASAYSAAAMSGARNRGPDPAAMQEKLFNKLDVNGDGGIDKSELGDFLEYVSSSTGSSAKTDSVQLFESLDADGDGSISKQDFSDGAKKLFDALRSQLGGSASAGFGPPAGAGAPPPGVGGPPPGAAPSQGADSEDTNKLFSALDQNGDGKISQEELNAALSKQSEDSAGNGAPGALLFSRIESLIDQYRSTATDNASTEGGTQSTVTAVA